MNRFVKYSALIFAATAMLLNLSCKDKETEEVRPDPVPFTHVALSGGGWRAHTAHSGWHIALLENGSRSLSDVYQNVSSISSNSGGSWFSTMLMFSSDFVSQIQSPTALSDWSTSGWLGTQATLFTASGCSTESVFTYPGCVLRYYGNGDYWLPAVENLVFSGYSTGSTTLNDARQPWAGFRPLLLAGSLLTSNTVLNGTFFGKKLYYQACLSDNNPSMGGDGGSNCDPIAFAWVSPVTFSSVPANSAFTAPEFLAAPNSGTSPSLFTIGYTDNDGDTPSFTSFQNPLANSGVPVMTAAATSSAAGGFAASESVSGAWLAGYEGEDLAISYSLSNSTVTYMETDDLSIAELAQNTMVRIADGGAVDNSAVAQTVRFLQTNDLASDFSIVAFDNVQQIYDENSGQVQAGIDIANLFGKGICPGDKVCADLKCSEFCVNVPDLQIFVQDSISTPTTWTYTSNSTENQQILVYTKYSVVTTQNDALGISGGSQGTLHAFTCMYSNAPTAPADTPANGGFTPYDNMLQFINTGLNADQGKGLQYLEAAMGISD